MMFVIGNGWARLALDLDSLSRLCDAREPKLRAAVVAPDYASLQQILGRVRAGCLSTKLNMTVVQIDRTLTALRNQTLTYEQLAESIRALHRRFLDESSSVVFVHIARRLLDYFGAPDAFGETVASAFPSAVFDIEEAGNCLAFGRNTASVMHLMRVVECGLRVVAESLGVAAEFKTWEPVIRKLRTELEGKYPAIDPAMKGKREFYSHVFDRLTAIKDAIRNPAMHARENYDESQAIETYRAVKAFIQTVAEGLAEHKA